MVLISKLKPQAMGPSTNRDADNICLSTYIMYYKNQRILYKGNWINNMAHGYGEEYNNEGNLIYSGEWKYNSKCIN